jgi:hypothetical protein
MIPLYDAGFAHWFAGILSVILVIGSAERAAKSAVLGVSFLQAGG